MHSLTLPLKRFFFLLVATSLVTGGFAERAPGRVIEIYTYEEKDKKVRARIAEVFEEVVGASPVYESEGQLVIDIPGESEISRKRCYLNIGISRKDGYSVIYAQPVIESNGRWVAVEEDAVYLGSRLLLEGVSKELNRKYVDYMSPLEQLYTIQAVPEGMEDQYSVVSFASPY